MAQHKAFGAESQMPTISTSGHVWLTFRQYRVLRGVRIALVATCAVFASAFELFTFQPTAVAVGILAILTLLSFLVPIRVHCPGCSEDILSRVYSRRICPSCGSARVAKEQPDSEWTSCGCCKTRLGPRNIFTIRYCSACGCSLIPPTKQPNKSL